MTPPAAFRLYPPLRPGRGTRHEPVRDVGDRPARKRERGAETTTGEPELTPAIMDASSGSWNLASRPSADAASLGRMPALAPTRLRTSDTRSEGNCRQLERLQPHPNVLQRREVVPTNEQEPSEVERSQHGGVEERGRVDDDDLEGLPGRVQEARDSCFGDPLALLRTCRRREQGQPTRVRGGEAQELVRVVARATRPGRRASCPSRDRA